jgi:hypothetical protein
MNGSQAADTNSTQEYRSAPLAASRRELLTHVTTTHRNLGISDYLCAGKGCVAPLAAGNGEQAGAVEGDKHGGALM